MAPVRPPGRAYGFVRNKTHTKDNMKMKTLKSAVAFTVIAAFSSFGLMAGEMKEDAMKDCAMMKDGKMMVMKDGKTMAMEHTMTMSDGTKVTKKGMMKMANGKKPSEENVLAKINEGGNGMPAYKEMLSEEEKDDLIAYLKTL